MKEPGSEIKAKPIIRITRPHPHPNDIKPGEDLGWNYWLYLPWNDFVPDWQKPWSEHWREFPLCATSDPNDCLSLIICMGIELK